MPTCTGCRVQQGLLGCTGLGAALLSALEHAPGSTSHCQATYAKTAKPPTSASNGSGPSHSLVVLPSSANLFIFLFAPVLTLWEEPGLEVGELPGDSNGSDLFKG